MDRFCDYDEGYTKVDAEDFGWCRNCTISSCRNSKYYGGYGKGIKNAMYMTPNDYTTIIAKKDAEIQRLKKIVAEVTENIKVIGKQNTRLKRKCDRYEKKLTELYLNGVLSEPIKE